MARTHRAQVLMEPDRYQRLEAIAAQRKTSVASLIREAVDEKWFNGDGAQNTVGGFDWDALELGIDFGTPEDIRAEIATKYADVDLP